MIVSDNDVSAGGHYETLSIGDGGHGGFGGGGGKGFSAGSGLKTIAQGSAEQANNAVVNQHAAARQAAFAAKSNLAQAALGVSLPDNKIISVEEIVMMFIIHRQLLPLKLL